MIVLLNGRDDLVEPALRILRSAIDVGDGGTPEQRRLLGLVASHLFGVGDLHIDELAPITPIEAAEAIDDPVAAHRLQHFLVLMEVLRSPLSEEQVALVDGFGLALGGDDEGLHLVRGVAHHETGQAVEHLRFAWAIGEEEISAHSVRARYEQIDVKIDDPELAAGLRAFQDLPRGTLGREYIEFYLANHFDIPGENVPNPAFFVQHDMSHLIAGLGPSAPGELAHSAFLVGMRDNDAHWLQFVLGLAAYELGALTNSVVDFEAKAHLLERDGVIELILDSYERGTRCNSNYNEVDLLALADRPIVELRTRFGVEPPAEPFPEFIDATV